MEETSDRDTLGALFNFLEHFELVFDMDWEYTVSVLKDTFSRTEYHELGDGCWIEKNGTFIRTGIEDEGNNWFNRGSLLVSYRAAKSAMVKFRSRNDGFALAVKERYPQLPWSLPCP